jgi:hypothetical protein
MSDAAGDSDADSQKFLRSLLMPDRALGAQRELGTTPLARRLALPDDQLAGHWCSRCQGIWYGCMLEVECPVCGNRHG